MPTTASKRPRQYESRAYFAAQLTQSWRRWRALARGQGPITDASRIDRIESLAEECQSLDDTSIKARFGSLRRKVSADPSLPAIESVVEQTFALVREASRRATGLFHYPEQLLGGLAMVRGGIAEMATGEGKTLAATLPAAAFALAGKGVHVVTVNPYLAERDFDFTRPVFERLGLSSAFLPDQEAGPDAKHAAYRADITYGVGYEFGFDYLRDQLVLLRQPHPGPRERLREALLGHAHVRPNVAQRGLGFAIVDEIDSVLIDEAGSPLLISQSAQMDAGAALPFLRARDLVAELEEDTHYLLEPVKRSVNLTPLGREEVHDASEIPWHLLQRPWDVYILNALKARHFFDRDVHYVVEEDKVMIVDEFTGRRHEERTWREGLHQAIEVKEQLDPRPESLDAASITRQRFYALYEGACGLTGTATESAGEFWHFFKLPVIPIPEHRPCQRQILSERVFASAEDRDAAVCAEVADCHSRLQPVLVGTRTIRVSERLSERLEQEGIPHRVLNAKQDAEESAVVGTAGEPGNVLIATNMAGRGTHIDLSAKAEAAGGLHVIQVERNESTRIDRQLVGRAARQGQPGSARVYVSADDAIFEQDESGLVERLRNSPRDDQGELSQDFGKEIDVLQHQVETKRYHQRLRLAHRDENMDQTRRTLA